MNVLDGFNIESAGHLIQVALTPAFLLSAIAALLNVFASRLARVADRLDALTDSPPAEADVGRQIMRLHHRTFVLDAAVVLGTVAAAAICLAILLLFVLAVSNRTAASVVIICFGVSLVCTLGAIAAFGVEMLMSSQELRRRT